MQEEANYADPHNRILSDALYSVFAFEGQNMAFTVSVLLTCILNYDTGPGYD